MENKLERNVVNSIVEEVGKKVLYVVGLNEEGNSDVSIEGVFEDREDAESFVEEKELDSSDVFIAEMNMNIRKVDMCRNS